MPMWFSSSQNTFRPSPASSAQGTYRQANGLFELGILHHKHDGLLERDHPPQPQQPDTANRIVKEARAGAGAGRRITTGVSRTSGDF